jgi:hypothetical protein
MAQISITLGQAIHWAPAASAVAQVVELRRRKVRICYPCKNGRLRFPVVSVDRVAKSIETTPLLPVMHNPFGRAIRRQQIRTFEIGTK